MAGDMNEEQRILGKQVHSRNRMAVFDRLPPATRAKIRDSINGDEFMGKIVMQQGRLIEVHDMEDLRKELGIRCEKDERGQSGVAAELQVSRAYVNQIVKAGLDISTRVADALGYERRVVYVKKGS